MSKRTWVEMICDGCGCADHFVPGITDEEAREAGWTLTKDGKHYCRKQCIPVKRTVRRNRYGNWRGYEGGRFVREFGVERASYYGGLPQVGSDMDSGEMPEAARLWLNNQEQEQEKGKQI